MGQSGGGKTVFMNFIVDQMLKYANKDTFPDDIPEKNRKFTAVYLDKDKGALGNILCAGGRLLVLKMVSLPVLILLWLKAHEKT